CGSHTRYPCSFLSSFSFNVTAPTAIYTLSLHDALPISVKNASYMVLDGNGQIISHPEITRLGKKPDDPWIHDILQKKSGTANVLDRKSTRLNSSHVKISYAVFCLKKKKSKSGLNKSNIQ